MPASGGDPVQLTFFEHASSSSPAWSSDGQRIAFVCYESGTSKVWEISAEGGNAHSLEKTDASNTNRFLAWWPSRDVIYQSPGVRNYLRIDEKTQVQNPLLQREAGWVPLGPAFSPDGNKMAVYWNRICPRGNSGCEDHGVWIVSLEPYSETLLQKGELYPFGWSSDGKFVYVLLTDNPPTKGVEIIKIQASAPYASTLVASLTGADSDGATVSPSGREIVVSIEEEKSDVWLLENF